MDLHSKLADVLAQHFQDVSVEAITYQANEIYESYSASASLQKIERSNALPQQDIESIAKAIQSMKRAEASLRKVGWHGGNALVPMAQKIKGEGNPEHWKAVVGNTDSADIVADKIGELVAGLADAKEHIPSDAAPVFEYLGEEYSSGGQPAKTAAYFVAKECATAFQTLSGNAPTIIVDAHSAGSPARGPFLEFVKDIFEILALKASPEGMARKVSKERTRKNRR
jgi:hypothetical protein